MFPVLTLLQKRQKSKNIWKFANPGVYAAINKEDSKPG